MKRIADLSSVPQSALNVKVRVSATVRKYNKSGPYYDHKNQLLTEWLPVANVEWVVQAPHRPLVVADDLDLIRIEVHVRGLLGANAEAGYTDNSIMLQPSRTHKQLSHNMRQNIFNAVTDYVRSRGERDCGD